MYKPLYLQHRNQWSRLRVRRSGTLDHDFAAIPQECETRFSFPVLLIYLWDPESCSTIPGLRIICGRSGSSPHAAGSQTERKLPRWLVRTILIIASLPPLPSSPLISLLRSRVACTICCPARPAIARNHERDDDGAGTNLRQTTTPAALG